MNTQIIEKVKINNPIGNLYRKRHVLILVADENDNFILGKKKDFYPDHIARMLGGGINNEEDPVIAAKREIEEELDINLPIDAFIFLCSVITQASTNEGDMEMQTWVYFVKIEESNKIKPSDDISAIKIFNKDEYEKLILDISNLSGEFVTEKFSFQWSDWGKIYGPIHKYAFEAYNKLIK